MAILEVFVLLINQVPKSPTHGERASLLTALSTLYFLKINCNEHSISVEGNYLMYGQYSFNGDTVSSLCTAMLRVSSEHLNKSTLLPSAEIQRFASSAIVLILQAIKNDSIM